MLKLFDWVGGLILWILIGSRADTDPGKAKSFALAIGSFTSGVILGSILYLLSKACVGYAVPPEPYLSSRICTWCKLDALTAFVWIPAGAIILTFVIENIRKETRKVP